MAKWKVKPGFKDHTLSTVIDYDDGGSRMMVEQDEKPFVDMVKEERETHSQNHTHMKKFCTIPDIVAIEIFEKWGMDVHSPTFMHDPDALKKLKTIMLTDYRHLVVGT